MLHKIVGVFALGCYIVYMENENRHEKFTRLAEARTSKVLETIDLIGNLSNKSSYSYTEDEVEQIFNAIRKACDENEAKFKTGRSKKSKKFTLGK